MVIPEEEKLPTEEVSAEDAATEEVVPEPTAGETAKPTGINRLREHFADKNYGDDDELYGAAADHIGELRGRDDIRSKSDKEIAALFKAHPRLAQVMQYIMQGAPEMEAISRVFDPEDLIRYEGEPDYDQWKTGKQKREEDMKVSDDRNASFELNHQASRKAVDDFCTDNALGDEDKDALLDSLFAVYDDLLDGKLSAETLLLFHKGNSHDEDVANAATQGKIEGKNAKIDVKKQVSVKGDQLPEINGGGASVVKKTPEKDSIPIYKGANAAIEEAIRRNKKA